MNIGALLEPVKDLAILAGEAILEIYNDPAGFEVEKKSDQSPLTRADSKSNEIICEGLINLNASIPIVSEENKSIPFEERKDYEYLWLVDPLDGTKEFIKRNGNFTVNIALIHRGKPVLGVVYVPVNGELYSASKGNGAYLQQNQDKTRISVKTFTSALEGVRVVCSRSHLNPDTEAYLSLFINPRLVPTGSSLKFLLIAKGDADLYPRLGPTMEWDTAAAQMVLEEAGGSVLMHDTNEPLEYNKPSLLNPYFIASGREIFG